MDFNRRNTISTEGGMSSMTDLVFLMLIFFILLSTQVTSGLKVEIPKAEGSVGASSSISVGINPDSEFFIGTTPVERDELEEKLQALFLDREQEDKIIVLKADEMAPTGATMGIVGMAKVNQWKVVVQTKNPK